VIPISTIIAVLLGLLLAKIAGKILDSIDLDEDDSTKEADEKIDPSFDNPVVKNEYDFVFENYGVEKVASWVRNLDLFYYTTHQWDKGTWAQDFVVNILWEDEKELYAILGSLGVEPEIHNVIDQENTWQYSQAIPNLVEPGECVFNGIKCWLEILDFRERKWIRLIIIDQHPHEDLTDYIFEQTKRMEDYLKKMDLNYMRPSPQSARSTVSIETHPELWDSP